MTLKYLLFFAVFLFSGTGQALASQDELLHRYHTLKEKYSLTKKLTLQSSTEDGRLTADVYSSVDFSFKRTKGLLQQPGMWCEFLTLHLNVKSCLVAKGSELTDIVVFAGRKHYEEPADTDYIKYRFQPVQVSKTFLSVELTAESGPFGTSDYIIRLQAAPSDSGTVLHVHTAYTTSMLSRLGSSVYLSTRGRHKVGFSISGHDELRQPIYVGGVKGIIERNAVRYYLALNATFQTWSLPDSKRLEARIKRWFEMTQVHKQQLYELEWAEYQAAKRKEYNNQRYLQQLLNKGVDLEEILNDDE